MFFRQKAREASDEKTAKQFARYADRAFNTPALYHHFLPSTVANHAVSRLFFEIATALPKMLSDPVQEESRQRVIGD